MIGEPGLLLSLGRDSLGRRRDVFGFSGRLRSGTSLTSGNALAECAGGVVKGSAGCDPDAIADADADAECSSKLLAS